jgi:hypothetical protein
MDISNVTYADVILSYVSEGMNTSGPVWLFLSECVSVLRSGTMFHMEGTPCAPLADSSLSRFAESNNKKDGRGLR